MTEISSVCVSNLGILKNSRDSQRWQADRWQVNFWGYKDVTQVVQTCPLSQDLGRLEVTTNKSPFFVAEFWRRHNITKSWSFVYIAETIPKLPWGTKMQGYGKTISNPDWNEHVPYDEFDRLCWMYLVYWSIDWHSKEWWLSRPFQRAGWTA